MKPSVPVPDRGSRRSSGRSRLLTAVLVISGVTVFALGITARLAGLQIQTVVSNSMQPTASAGDVAVTQPVPVGSVRVGDVIAFYPPGSTRPILHRITSVDDGAITTRGDANPIDDPWRVTLQGPTAQRLVAVIPLIGWLSQLRFPALLLAGTLAGLAILRELRKGVRASTTRTRSRTQP